MGYMGILLRYDEATFYLLDGDYIPMALRPAGLVKKMCRNDITPAYAIIKFFLVL